jgi:hypothetical protein
MHRREREKHDKKPATAADATSDGASTTLPYGQALVGTGLIKVDQRGTPGRRDFRRNQQSPRTPFGACISATFAC